MKNIDYFFDLLNKSDITLLGYSFKDERIKDEIISKLPHLEINEIDSSFSFKSYIRNLKINNVLWDSKIPTIDETRLLVFDLSKIKIDAFSPSMKYELTKSIMESIRSEIFKNSSFFKILLTAPTNKSIFHEEPTLLNFFCGMSPVYISDVCCVLKEDNIKVLKNRYSEKDIEISLDGLKDYNYICDYENN